MLVERVMAGVVEALATLPAKPLAETTEAEVTVPEPPPGVNASQAVPPALTRSDWPA